MIILLIFIAFAIAVPVAVEAVRSPEENLVRETTHEFSEFVIEPLQSWAKETVDSLSVRYRELVIVSIFDYLKSLFRSLVQLIKDIFR